MNTTSNTQTTSDRASANTAKTKDTTAETGTRRAELRRRVEARVCELEEALTSLKSQEGNVERCRALETDLQLAKDCMMGGWEKVGEVEAAKLTQWLETTQTMTGTTAGVPKGATVPGQVVNATEDGRTTVESSPPATSKPYKMPQA
jgi:hypothetical protein